MALRYVIVLSAIFIVGWIYSILAVPWIEGSVRHDSNSGPTSAVPPPGDRSRRYDLTQLLPENAWEVGNCIRLETEQGQLFFKTYRQLDDGRLEVEPLTIIFDSDAEQRSTTNPTVLRAPQGAVLRFSEPFALGKSSLGKLEYSWLKGEVRIYRHATARGNDAFEITTANVSVDEQRITTPNDVSFQFGPHRGWGRNLTLDLLPSNSPYQKSSSMTSFGDLGVLELVNLDRMVIVPPDRSLDEINPNAVEASEPTTNRDPDEVVIRCNGPFRFDFQAMEASFRDAVRVTRVATETGLTDQLTCNLLKAIFQEKLLTEGDLPTTALDTDGEPANTTAVSRMKNLELSALEAYGSPAIFDLPSQKGRAEGEIMIYEPATDRIYLKSQHGLIVEHDEQRFETLELQYTFLRDGRLGNAIARGPGRFYRKPTEKRAALEIRWQDELRIRPDQNLKAISLYGQPEVNVGAESSFRASRLHLWLDEIPEEPAHPTPVPGEAPGKQKFRLVPVKMLAEGPVDAPSSNTTPSNAIAAESGTTKRLIQFDSSRLQAETDHLEVFFTAPLAASARVDQSSTASTAAENGSTINPTNSLADSLRGQPTSDQRPGEQPPKLHCSGDLTRIRLTPNGEEYYVDELTIGGHVHLFEAPSATREAPLELRGNVLQATSRGANFYYMIIQGDSSDEAFVSARGLSLSGNQINLDQLANQIWIEGPGEAIVRNSDKKLQELDQSQPRFAADRRRFHRPTRVLWQDHMVFDGQTVTVEGDVRASGTQWMISGDRTDWTATSGRLAFILDRRVDLSQPDKNKEEPQAEVDRIELQRGVKLNSDSFDELGNLGSREELIVPELSINQTSGEIVAIGAGTATTTRRGGMDSLGSELQPQPTDPRASQPENPRRADLQRQEREQGLTYLQVEFSGGIVGNLHRREIHFVRDVDTIVGPVLDWDQTLDRNVPLHSPDVEHARLLCDRLIVAQWGEDSTGKPMVEVQGLGNAFVAGQGFEATGAKVAFNQLQNMIILEGDQHAYAKLVKKTQGVDAGEFFEGMKIIYWRAQQRVDADGSHHVRGTISGRLTTPQQMKQR